MVEFRTMGYHPMDREYHESMSEAPEPVQLEEPIYPIRELGETVPEQDPTGRFKSIIQTTQAAIRGGAGTVQLVMMTPHTSPIGGRPKAYGKEVRQALREVAQAADVNIAGVEMPTSSLTNMTGFDQQQLTFSDEKLRENINEVREAMQFIADVGGGGGVDLVSFEFPREINEAPWQPMEKDKRQFQQQDETGLVWVVDERTGRTAQIRKTERLHLAVDKKNFKHIPFEGEEPELNVFEWEDFQRWAEHNRKENERLGRKGDEKAPERPEQIYIQQQIDGQIRSLEGMRTQYYDRAREMQDLIRDREDKLKFAQTEDDKQRYQQEIDRLERQRNDYLNSAEGNARSIKNYEEQKNSYKPMTDYGMQRAAHGYAEAGINAFNVTQEGLAKGTVRPDKPVYVGPEISWPGHFGSHPDEFIQIVTSARDRMVDLMTSKHPKDIHGKEMKENPYYNPGLTKEQAKEYAKKHVKGLFDTSHVGMWLQYFPAKPGETEEKRVERFNKEFYLPAVEKLAKSDVVGGIQMVDAITGSHAHLPPGQGVLPLRETAQIFKDSNYGGFIVSEGHEEEKFGEGRIRTKLWETAGGYTGGSYFGKPLQWGHVQGGYFGKTYSPNFMFGGYSPSNEFKLWSDVPLE